MHLGLYNFGKSVCAVCCTDGLLSESVEAVEAGAMMLIDSNVASPSVFV